MRDIPRKMLPPEEKAKRDAYIMKRHTQGIAKAQIAREIGWSAALVRKVIEGARRVDLRP